MNTKSEDVIINALNHEIRRDILRLLEGKSLSYTNLLDYFVISSGKLNYHLKLLTGFIQKNDEGFYKLTELGQRVLLLLGDFQKILEEQEPYLKKAYYSQLSEKRSFLHIRLVGGIYFKLVAVIAIVILVIISSVLYAIEGVDLLNLWPIYLLLAVIVPIAIIWVLKSYKPAKEFAKRMDKLLNDSE